MQNTNINFVGMRKGAYVISGILILAAIIGLAVRGLNWSIDFTSGVAAKVDLKALDTSVAPIQIDDLELF
jgi:preprotein translocase subunit SecF